MLAVLLVASAAYGADVTISCTAEANLVTVHFEASAEVNIPRAFALDIELDNAEKIHNVTPLMDDPNEFWVYPGTYPASPGSPVGDPCDSDDTLPGEDHNGVTIEMASLHSPPEATSPNAPGQSGDLLSFTVTGSCNVNITGNAARGKVVFYDATNEDDGRDVVYTGCPVLICCPGDGDNDEDYDLDDYGAMVGKLQYAKYLTGKYLVVPPEVNETVGFLWDPCYDMKPQDNDIDLDDYGTMVGKLQYAKYLTGKYLVVPTDVNATVGFLWDCNP
jgi:hypothetical protein